MGLELAFQDILENAPWVDHVRLIVGPLASREFVKDALFSLKKIEALPSWTVGTLADLASEFVVLPQKPLSAASRIDALMQISGSDLMQKRVPDLCSHLKHRSVAAKISKFLTHLEKFYVHEEELQAVIEYYSQKDKSLGSFLEIISLLWSRGELKPWGEGEILRQALEVLDKKKFSAKTIWLWGFYEFSPLEEAFLEKLASFNSIKFFIPQTILPVMQQACEKIQIEAVPLLDEPNGEISLWQPHSIWDELEFLRDELEKLKNQGVPWNQIAIFVPKDALYKRIVRDHLKAWNVPLIDPTLADHWKDFPEWMWWVDFLKIIAKGMPVEEVRGWLGGYSSEENKDLYSHSYALGISGGAAKWEKLLKKHPHPQLARLVEGAKLFNKSITPKDFLKIAQTLEIPLFVEFAQHLCEKREYLENFKARLSRYIPLFEEYLESKARENSLSNRQGLFMIGHGNWLPRVMSQVFVLGAGFYQKAQPVYDHWEWEGHEVRCAWEYLHFGIPWEQRVARDQAFTSYGFFSHSKTMVSQVTYDLEGKPTALGPLMQKLQEKFTFKKKGGHEKAGWAMVSSHQSVDLKKQEVCLEQFQVPSPLRISAFEDYLKCPFLFYGRHVLRLEPERTLGLDPDASIKGRILHKVLERFIDLEINTQTHGALEEAKKLMSHLVDQEMATGFLPGLFRHKPLVEKFKQSMKSMVSTWVEWEYNNRKIHPAVKPRAVEVPIEFELEGLKLSGRVDRVDSDGKHALIIDYKSGGNELIGKELLAGIGSQLLMYLHGISKSYHLIPGGAYYLSVKRNTAITGGVFLKQHVGHLYSTHSRNSGLTEKSFEEIFNQTYEAWAKAAKNLKSGKFTPDPKRPQKDCVRCSYRPICGYYES